MLPRLFLFDLATQFQNTGFANGVDAYRWREMECEMDAHRSERLLVENAIVQTPEMQKPKPWSGGLIRSKLPIDTDTTWGPIALRLWRRGAAESVFSLAREFIFDKPPAALASLADVQQWFGPVFRATSENEQKGLLKAPVVALGNSLAGGFVVPELPDNDFFEPFDLRNKDDFLFFLGDKEVSYHAAMQWGNGNVFLFLRPRQWRFFARVIAHYVYVTWFEEVPNDEVFLKVFYDRFPIFPWRVNLQAAKQFTIWHPYEGAYLFYDYAIDQKWQHSRAASEMRSEMLQQQWFSLCAAYIFLYAEPAAITIWREKPVEGETVCFLGCSGTLAPEKLVRVVRKGGSNAYPRTLIGTFWGDAP